MTLTKPETEIPTIYVTAKDKKTGRTKTMTFYNASPEVFFEQLVRLMTPKSREPKKHHAVS